MRTHFILPATALILAAAGCGSTDTPEAQPGLADATDAAQDLTELEPGTDLEAPLPFGGSLVFDDWIVAVTGVDLDATERVTDATGDGTGPEEGYEYVVFSLEFTYIGGDPAHPASEFDFAVWADAERYDDDCGLIPDDLTETMNDEGHLSAGGTLAADSCVQLPADTVASQLILEVHLNAPSRAEDFGYLVISHGD